MPEPMGGEGSISIGNRCKWFRKKFLCLSRKTTTNKINDFFKNNTLDELEEKISDCDYVFHFAEVNRSNNAYDFVAGNKN